MTTYLGRREQQIDKRLEKGPFFMGELFSDTGKYPLHTIRNMKMKGKDVLMFRHNKGRVHRKSQLPFFIIVFKSTQRIEAWNMLLKRFPQVNQLRDKWINMGAPILNGLVRRTKNDTKIVGDSKCARCGGRARLKYSRDFKKTLCNLCENEIRGIIDGLH